MYWCEDFMFEWVDCLRHTKRMSAVPHPCMDLCKHSESGAGAPLLRYFSTLSLTDPFFSAAGSTRIFSFFFCFMGLKIWFVHSVCDRSDKKMSAFQTLINLSCNLFLHSSGNKMCKWDWDKEREGERKRGRYTGWVRGRLNKIFPRLQPLSFLAMFQVW